MAESRTAPSPAVQEMVRQALASRDPNDLLTMIRESVRLEHRLQDAREARRALDRQTLADLYTLAKATGDDLGFLGQDPVTKHLHAAEHYDLAAAAATELGDTRAAGEMRDMTEDNERTFDGWYDNASLDEKKPAAARRLLHKRQMGLVNQTRPNVGGRYTDKFVPDAFDMSKRSENCQRNVFGGIGALFGKPFNVGEFDPKLDRGSASDNRIQIVNEFAFGGRNSPAVELEDLRDNSRTELPNGAVAVLHLDAGPDQPGGHAALLITEDDITLFVDPQTNFASRIDSEQFEMWCAERDFTHFYTLVVHDPRTFKMDVDMPALAHEAHEEFQRTKFATASESTLRKRLQDRTPREFDTALKRLESENFASTPKIQAALATADEVMAHAKTPDFSIAMKRLRETCGAWYLHSQRGDNPNVPPSGLTVGVDCLAEIDGRPIVFTMINNRPVNIDLITRTAEPGFPAGAIIPAINIGSITPERLAAAFAEQNRHEDLAAAVEKLPAGRVLRTEIPAPRPDAGTHGTARIAAPSLDR